MDLNLQKLAHFVTNKTRTVVTAKVAIAVKLIVVTASLGQRKLIVPHHLTMIGKTIVQLKGSPSHGKLEQKKLFHPTNAVPFILLLITIHLDFISCLGRVTLFISTTLNLQDQTNMSQHV